MCSAFEANLCLYFITTVMDRAGKEADAQDNDTKCGSLKENGRHKEQYY